MRKKYQKKSTTPMYKEGGQTKQEWISAKINYLIQKEGKKQDQAVAQAISMAEDVFQQGGNFNYEKTGNIPISQQDVTKINQGTGIQFTPEFSQSYFSTQSAPPTQQTSTTNVSQKPVVDITMGLGSERKVWNVRPETLIGKEPQEGVHYYVVPPKKWGEFQQSTPYYSYINQTAPQNNQIVDEFKEGGELPMYQNAGYYDIPLNQPTQPNYFQSNVNVANPFVLPPTQKKSYTKLRLPTIEETTVNNQNANSISPQQSDTQQWAQSFTTQVPQPLTSTQAATVAQVSTAQRPQIEPVDIAITPMGVTYGTPQEQLIKSTTAATGQLEQQYTEPNTNTQKPQPFQFINPGGVSIETAANIFGQGLANKNPLDIITGGLKVATGLGRNILAPYASNVANDRVNAQAAEDMRDSLTRTGQAQALTDQGWKEGLGYYGQEGGEMPNENPQEQMLMQVAQAIQQGAAPEEVLQQLISKGLDEQTATQLVQMVMQELQAQTPPPEEQPMMQKGGTLDSLKGKRIVDYKLNPSTGNYTVTYED